MKTITPAFPCLIYEDETKDFDLIKDGIIQYAYNQERRYPESNKKSNYGGWQTPNPKFFTEDEEFQPYVDWFGYRIKEYLEHLDYDEKKKYGITVTSFWFNINRRFNFNIAHNHPNSNLAGVLWVKIPKDSGTLVFESPHEFAESNTMYLQKQNLIDRYLAWERLAVEPKEGNMIIFPSHLRHRVTENLSTEDRISLAFNLTVDVG